MPLQKTYSANPRIISAQGLTITSARTVLRHDWRIFGEARETEAYFLLIYAEDPKQFLFLPKKAYENPALARPITWEISEEQITAKDQLSQINYQWSVFRPVPETEEFFFLIFSADKNQFFYFPKRVITSPGNMDRFRELARRRLG